MIFFGIEIATKSLRHRFFFSFIQIIIEQCAPTLNTIVYYFRLRRYRLQVNEAVLCIGRNLAARFSALPIISLCFCANKEAKAAAAAADAGQTNNDVSGVIALQVHFFEYIFELGDPKNVPLREVKVKEILIKD